MYLCLRCLNILVFETWSSAEKSWLKLEPFSGGSVDSRPLTQGLNAVSFLYFQAACICFFVCLWRTNALIPTFVSGSLPHHRQIAINCDVIHHLSSHLYFFFHAGFKLLLPTILHLISIFYSTAETIKSNFIFFQL